MLNQVYGSTASQVHVGNPDQKTEQTIDEAPIEPSFSNDDDDFGDFVAPEHSEPTENNSIHLVTEIEANEPKLDSTQAT